MTSLSYSGNVTNGIAAVALETRRFVSITAANVVNYTPAGGIPDGITTASAAANQPVSVVLLSDSGRASVMVTGTVAFRDRLYVGANGQATATPNGISVMEALSAATNAFVECKYSPNQVNGGLIRINSTVDRTVTIAESGAYLQNRGAAGTVIFTLPAANPNLTYRVNVAAAQQLRLLPVGTNTITIGTSTSTTGQYAVNSTVGSFLTLVCGTAGSWEAIEVSGTWTFA